MVMVYQADVLYQSGTRVFIVRGDEATGYTLLELLDGALTAPADMPDNTGTRADVVSHLKSTLEGEIVMGPFYPRNAPEKESVQT